MKNEPAHNIWQKHLQRLVHLTQFSQLLLAVSTTCQTSLSTFKSLYKEMILNKHFKIHTRDATNILTSDNLLHEVASCFPVIPPTISGKQLDTIKLAASESLHPTLIMIEDAQLLTMETLAAISELTQSSLDKPHQLHFLLIGEPDLSDRLMQTTLRANLHHVDLPPLLAPKSSTASKTKSRWLVPTLFAVSMLIMLLWLREQHVDNLHFKQTKQTLSYNENTKR